MRTAAVRTFNGILLHWKTYSAIRLAGKTPFEKLWVVPNLSHRVTNGHVGDSPSVLRGEETGPQESGDVTYGNQESAFLLLAPGPERLPHTLHPLRSVAAGLRLPSHRPLAIKGFFVEPKSIRRRKPLAPPSSMRLGYRQPGF